MNLESAFQKRYPYPTGFDKNKINPIDYMRSLGWTTDHINYDPAMRKGDYYLIRQAGHDGTMIFEDELLQDTLVNLANRVSCHKSQEGVLDHPGQITYVVGPLKLATVYGMVDLRAGRFPGVRQRTRIPVRAVIRSAVQSVNQRGER